MTELNNIEKIYNHLEKIYNAKVIRTKIVKMHEKSNIKPHVDGSDAMKDLNDKLDKLLSTIMNNNPDTSNLNNIGGFDINDPNNFDELVNKWVKNKQNLFQIPIGIIF